MLTVYKPARTFSKFPSSATCLVVLHFTKVKMKSLGRTGGDREGRRRCVCAQGGPALPFPEESQTFLSYKLCPLGSQLLGTAPNPRLFAGPLPASSYCCPQSWSRLGGGSIRPVHGSTSRACRSFLPPCSPLFPLILHYF